MGLKRHKAKWKYVSRNQVIVQTSWFEKEI